MAVILNILNGFNVAIYAGRSSGKSLRFQDIFRVKIEAIIFVTSPIMALIEDQVDE